MLEDGEWDGIHYRRCTHRHDLAYPVAVMPSINGVAIIKYKQLQHDRSNNAWGMDPAVQETIQQRYSDGCNLYNLYDLD